MQGTLQLSPDVIREFRIMDATPVAETALARVWKVTSAAHGEAALKLYKKPGMANEGPGFAFIDTLRGVAVVKLYGRTDGAVLMEWLGGHSLGDLTRAGRDAEAGDRLLAVARDIHSRTQQLDARSFPDLRTWFAALFALRMDPALPGSHAADIRRCQDIAERLLTAQRDIRPLHGDLHHDNVAIGPRGYCAFDAKGVVGERAYELANAFRNPKGAPELVRDPGRINHLATIWSQGFDTDRRRLLEWACAKCALSIAWRSGPDLTDDPELDLLQILLAVLRDAG